VREKKQKKSMVNELLPHNGLLIKSSARIPRAF
jgi:hypothetical protein